MSFWRIPQMSPMNWLIISILFIIVMLIMKSSFQLNNNMTQNKKYLNSINKKISW